MLGSSFTKSRSHEQNVNQKRIDFLDFSGPEKCPELKFEQTVVKPTDVGPGVSVTQNSQGKVTLKEIQLQVVNQQQSTRGKEEDAGSNDEDCGQSTRRGQNEDDSRMEDGSRMEDDSQMKDDSWMEDDSQTRTEMIASCRSREE